MKIRELKNGAYASSSAAVPQIVLARNSDAYQRMWSVLIGSGIAPAVDFPHESVIFLIDRQRNTGGYGLEPRRVDIDRATADVTVYLRVPKSGMATTQVITTPYSVIAVPDPAITAARWTDATSGATLAKTPERK